MQFRQPLLAVLALLAGCSPGKSGPVEVRDACGTFITEFSPRRTPEVRKSKKGLELVVSFAPGKRADVDAIVAAAGRGPVDLVIHPSKERVRAKGLEWGGYLILSVDSDAHATHVKDLLCF